MGIYLTQLAYQSLSESQALNAILTTITIHRSTSTVFRTVQLNCFRQNGIDSSAEHNRASTTHCFTSRSHSVVTWAGCGPLAKLRIELSPDGKLRLITWRTTTMNHPVGHTLRPINHNNTQHFKENQRDEQHNLHYQIFQQLHLVFGILLSFHILFTLCLSLHFLSYVIWTFHLEYKFILEILEF